MAGYRRLPRPTLLSRATMLRSPSRSPAEGLLEIVDTPEGERMRLQVDRRVEGLEATVTIDRPGRKVETLALCALPGGRTFQSTRAPAEPHEFSAQLHLGASGEREILPFHMSEPKGHRH